MTEGTGVIRINGAAEEDRQWRLFLAGDTRLTKSAENKTHVGVELQDRIQSSEFAVVNLEGPITTSSNPINKSGPNTKSVERTAELLASAGFNGVTLANNHTMDYGESGLGDTLDACSKHDLVAVGAGDSDAAALRPHSVSVGDTTLSVFSVCEQEFGLAGPDQPGTAWLQHQELEELLGAAADQSDVVILLAHGGIEYVPLPPPHLQQRYRELVDAGADLVVGHHPHVPQGWEQYGGAVIWYSLGNFLFKHKRRVKPHWGVSLDISFSGATLETVEILATELAGGMVEEMREDERTRHLGYLGRLADITADENTLIPHWQEQAVQVFRQRYTDWLPRTVFPRMTRLVRKPRRVLDIPRWWEDPRDDTHLLLLLNLIRNPSHRAVIQTALETETGVTPDYRTPETEQTLRELFEWTEDKPVYDSPSWSKKQLTAFSRLLRSLPSRQNAPGSPDGRTR